MIRCRITEVAPDSEFEGTAFTQIVTVELPTGQRLRLHDWTSSVSAEQRGKNVEVEVCVFEYRSLAVLPPRSGDIQGIRQDPQGRDRGAVAEVVGRIEGNEDTELRLDFGNGSVALLPNSEDLERFPSPGMLVRVSEARLDLTKIS